MVHIAQICIAILVISAVVSAAPCGNPEPSVATQPDHNTHLSCEKINNDESFDDGKDIFVDNTKYVAVTEEAPCDDEVDGISSEETNKSNSQNNGLIVVSSGKDIVGDINLNKVLNNLVSRDITQQEKNKSNGQSNGLIVVSSGKDIVDTVNVDNVLNNLISRDIKQKEKNDSNGQSNGLIVVSSGKDIVDNINLNNVLNDLLGGL
ncbi:hypothetical protein G6F37_010446 [Rhizopus arrhizus]|nr:hypothetical protein G6F38_009302 [Rhizopus arrhizus]KAG1153337.1 hypothetical protein G6F37_010446 [Rhizopus arrhizus]